MSIIRGSLWLYQQGSIAYSWVTIDEAKKLDLIDGAEEVLGFMHFF